ncbi:MAG: hypothetical protein ACYCS8_06345 [Acidithiobacillus sp.]
MKAIIKRSDLQGALKSALALHSEGGFLFEPNFFIALRKTADGELTVDLNDNTSQMAIRFPAELLDWPMGAGTCIPKKEGMNFLQFGNSEQLTVQPSDQDVALQSGKSKMTIKTIPLDKFNTLDYVPTSGFLEVSGKTLRSALEFTVRCFANTKDPKAVYLETDTDGNTQIYSTDDKGLSHAYLTDVQPSLESYQLKHAIAHQTANFMAKFLKDMPGDTPVRIYPDTGFLSFVSDDWVFRTQLLIAKTVSWRQLVHANGVSVCSADTEQFNDAIGESMSIIDNKMDDKNKTFKMDIGDEVVCYHHCEKGLAKGVFDAKVQNFAQFHLSASYAQDCLSGFIKSGASTVEVEQLGLINSGLVRMVNRDVPMKPSFTISQIRH